MTDPTEIAVTVRMGVSSLGVLAVAGDVAWGTIRPFVRPRVWWEGQRRSGGRTPVNSVLVWCPDRAKRYAVAERVLAARREGDRLGGERPCTDSSP